jgi:hypothetical protein
MDCNTSIPNPSSEISQNEDNNWPVFPEELDNICTDRKNCLLSLCRFSNASFSIHRVNGSYNTDTILAASTKMHWSETA